MPSHLLYLHAITPIHTGLGQSTGFIDLPIQRERLTGWPVIPGSSIKGMLRSACTTAGIEQRGIDTVFGPETENASDHAGGLMFGALRLLALPVRSYLGHFAWVTSPLVLRRWARDCSIVIPNAWDATSNQSILLSSDDARQTIGAGTMVPLEDRRLTLSVDPQLATIANSIADAVSPDSDWCRFFLDRFGLVSDETFSYFARTATDVTMRNHISDKRKVVERGQLWLEESIPAEAILAGVLTPNSVGLNTMRPSRDAPLSTTTEILISTIGECLDQTFQIGGNATVGRGLVHLRLAPITQAGAPQ